MTNFKNDPIIKSIVSKYSMSANPSRGYHDMVCLVIFKSGVGEQDQIAKMEEIRDEYAKENQWCRAVRKMNVDTWSFGWGWDSSG